MLVFPVWATPKTLISVPASRVNGTQPIQASEVGQGHAVLVKQPCPLFQRFHNNPALSNQSEACGEASRKKTSPPTEEGAISQTTKKRLLYEDKVKIYQELQNKKVTKEELTRQGLSPRLIANLLRTQPQRGQYLSQDERVEYRRRIRAGQLSSEHLTRAGYSALQVKRVLTEHVKATRRQKMSYESRLFLHREFFTKQADRKALLSRGISVSQLWNILHKPEKSKSDRKRTPGEVANKLRSDLRAEIIDLDDLGKMLEYGIITEEVIERMGFCVEYEAEAGQNGQEHDTCGAVAGSNDCETPQQSKSDEDSEKSVLTLSRRDNSEKTAGCTKV